MLEWCLINPQPTINSGFEYDEFEDYARDGFDELLTETQLGKNVLMCSGKFDGKKFEVEVETKGIIQSETPNAYTQGWQRQILTRMSDKVRNYKYIKYDGHIWVIMTMPSDNQIYDKCVLHLCNYVLKWQDKNGQIHYYPANIQDATQYNTGVEGTNEIHTGYIQLMAWVSLDEITSGLERDIRMFIDVDKKSPTPYVITSKSTIAYSYGEDNRVMRITFTEDEYNPETDSIEEWLCDYVRPEDIPEPTYPILISYLGNPELRIGGRKTFKSDVDVTYSIVVSDVWKDNLTLSQTDNSSCVIKCVNNSDMVGISFKVIATDASGNESQVLIKVIGGV